MSLQLVYAWSKKIHNLMMWLMLLLGIPMAITGIMMENEGVASWVAQMDWAYKVRWLHRALSSKFALALGVMMITGLLMWAVPKVLRRMTQSKLS